jgi:hypothetical protein
MRIDKHEVRGLLLQKRFVPVEEKLLHPEYRFWYLYASANGMNHLAVMGHRNKDNFLKVNLQDRNRVLMVTDAEPFEPGKIATVTFRHLSHFELFLNVVNAGAYVPVRIQNLARTLGAVE